MSELILESATRQTLEKIRHSKGLLPIYDLPHDLAEQAVWEAGRELLDEVGPPQVIYNQCRWMLREMAKLYRTRSGWDLAFELEVFLRKWTGYQMNPGLVQGLLRHCHARMKSLSPAQLESETGVGKVQDGAAV
jgi:hypothetical protein